MIQELDSFLDLPSVNTGPIEQLLTQDSSFRISITYPTPTDSEQFTPDQFAHLDPEVQSLVPPLINFLQLPTLEYHDESGALLDLPPRVLEAEIDKIDQAARNRLEKKDWPAFDEVIRRNKLRVNQVSTATTYLILLPEELGLGQTAWPIHEAMDTYKDLSRAEKDALVNNVHQLAVITLNQLKNR